MHVGVAVCNWSADQIGDEGLYVLEIGLGRGDIGDVVGGKDSCALRS